MIFNILKKPQFRTIRIRSLLAYVPTSIIPGAVGMLTFPFFTRWFNPEEFGLYQLVVVTITLIGSHGFGWLYQGILRYYSGTPGKREWKRYFGLSIVSSMIAGTLFLSVFFPLGESEEYLVPGLLFVLLFIPFNSLNVMNRIEKRPVRFTMLDSGLNAGKMIGGFLLIYLGFANLGLEAILWSGDFILLGGIILSLFDKIKNISSDSSIYPGTKRILSYGLPLTVSQFTSWIFMMSDVYIIKILLGDAAVGIFSSANSITLKTIMIIPTSLMLAVWPELVETHRKEGWKPAVDKHAEIVKFYMMIMLPITLAAILTGPPLFKIFIGEKFREGAVIIAPLAGAAFLKGLITLYMNVFYLDEKTLTATYLYVTSGVMKIIASVVFIKLFGIRGGAWATLIIYILLFIVVGTVTGRKYRVLLPWRIKLI